MNTQEKSVVDPPQLLRGKEDSYVHFSGLWFM